MHTYDKTRVISSVILCGECLKHWKGTVEEIRLMFCDSAGPQTNLAQLCPPDVPDRRTHLTVVYRQLSEFCATANIPICSKEFFGMWLMLECQYCDVRNDPGHSNVKY